MERKSIIASLLFSVTMAHATAQEKACSFHTVTPSSTNYLVEEVTDDLQEKADTAGAHAQGNMSVEEIERLIAYYEKKGVLKTVIGQERVEDTSELVRRALGV